MEQKLYLDAEAAKITGRFQDWTTMLIAVLAW